MFDLIQKASTAACICFYGIRTEGRRMLVTDSAGRKRYWIGYTDNGTVYWERAKELDEWI